MINTKDQEELFKLVADYLEKDIECVAIGGTAMMFSGYKNATKDIDLVFKTENNLNSFVKAINKLGYKEIALAGIYNEKRRKHKEKPRMFTRGDERFDLFIKSVFGYKLGWDTFVQRRDFLGKKELTMYVLPKEDLILLKAITGRSADKEDILTIMETEKDVDWERIVSNAIKQKNNNKWILVDLEETMQELKKKFFIKKEHFDRIYKAQG